MKVKKVLILVLTILITNVIFAQTAYVTEFKVDHVKYQITSINPPEVQVVKDSTTTNQNSNNYNNYNLLETIVIPSEVTYNQQIYTVTSIDSFAFEGRLNGNTDCYDCSKLTTISLPNTIRSIEHKAFICCNKLTNIDIPESVNFIADFAFWGCSSLERVVIPEGVTEIYERTFRKCTNLKYVVIPASVTNIGKAAFKYCENLDTIICLRATPPTLANDVFSSGVPANVVLTVPCQGVDDYQNNSSWNSFSNEGISSNCDYVSVTNGNFNAPSTWGVDNINGSSKKFRIKQEHIVTITTPVTISNNSQIINEGVLVIEQDGELFNTTNNNDLGIIEIKTPSLTEDTWNFIGAPLTGTDGKYKLETIIPGANDVSVSVFDYYDEGAGAWSTYWADIDTLIGEGEGFLVWPFADGEIAFSNYGDGMYSPNAHSTYSQYTYTGTPIYALNNENVVVSKTVVASPAPASGYWMALANPYTFRLNIATFLNNNTSIYNNQSQGNGSQIQGRCIYRLSNNTFSPVFSGALNVTEGFFVNFASAGAKTITFNKNQRYTGNAKALVQRELVKLTMIDGENESELFFACNEEAKQGYDIFDANKLFSLAEVTEPYFLTNEIPLVKEEVKFLPYYATMNVKSFRNKEVSFKATNIPEGISVSIIDGGEIIDLSEDVVYTTNISAGENANRFKVVFKNSVGLLDVKEWDIEITNNNRNVNVSSTENDLQIEVYNALGQKVYETKDYNFTLNQVSAGAYIIKAFNNKINESMKIIVK